jgi:hypothetical protein
VEAFVGDEVPKETYPVVLSTNIVQNKAEELVATPNMPFPLIGVLEPIITYPANVEVAVVDVAFKY